MVHHRNSAKTIKLAVVLDSVVKPQVILESDTGMAASVHVFGVPAPHLSTDLEHMRLNTFLLDLREKSVCTGITADVLQNVASLPDGTGSKQYFRYIINLPANVMFFHVLHYVKLVAASAPHHSGQSQYVQQLFACRKDSQCSVPKTRTEKPST